MSTFPDGPILIGYDGSANADYAIDVAAQLFGGGVAEVLHAWEPVSSAGIRSSVYAIAYDDSGDMLAREQALAEEVADRGVARATAAGFTATGGARSGSGPLWQTVVERAEELHPRLIVLGTRGLTGIRSALSGSVSHMVASHADVPVLTIPLARDEAR
jgi:nucleotide-binding universal stress UspA family protein